MPHGLDIIVVFEEHLKDADIEDIKQRADGKVAAYEQGIFNELLRNDPGRDEFAYTWKCCLRCALGDWRWIRGVPASTRSAHQA